jgi:glycosyltransferase involved in cell wall biosynthesis
VAEARVPDALRVALLSYRSKPHSGGQGVYVRHLSRELAALGHEVEVVSGPPYPELDTEPPAPGLELTRLQSLDLYREPDPFRLPHLREFRSPVDVVEWGLTATGGFPEPLTFSLRALAHLRRAAAAGRPPHVVHDNQGLGYGMLGVRRLGLPLVATVHHPVTIDRDLELAATASRLARLRKRRWYSFVRMQRRVLGSADRVITVSRSSAGDLPRELGVDPGRLRVVPVGVDAERFRPPTTPRVPRRVVAVASADVPLKGVVPLLEAVAKLRTETEVELVVVGSLRADGVTARTLDRLGLRDAVRFVSGVGESELVALFGSAEVAVVPSLYEGFSIPAVEAMACATPLVATTAGALPEVVGPDGECAVHVPPGDAEALAAALRRVLEDPGLRARLGAAGRRRVLGRFTWRAAAEQTVAVYREALGSRAALASRAAPC